MVAYMDSLVQNLHQYSDFYQAYNLMCLIAVQVHSYENQHANEVYNPHLIHQLYLRMN